MRIVFTAVPSYSHLVPVVLPVARLAQRAGHEVAVATRTDMVEPVERAGVPAIGLPNLVAPGDVARDPSLMRELGVRSLPDFRPGKVTMDVSPEWFAALFVNLAGGRFADALLAALDRSKPDLIVRESTEYGGYYAAERLGIPHATLDIAPMDPFGGPEAIAALNTQRERLRLEPVADAWDAKRDLRAGFVPEDFYPVDRRLPDDRHYRLPAGQQEQLDPAIAELPGDRPLVLASLGSNLPRMLDQGPSILDTIVGVLGKLPVTAVVALGREPESWHGACPDNVRLVSFVQQQLLLPACDVFITHAGFNGTREALGAGVPMVALPSFAEQPANAARITELGVGVHLRVEEVNPDTLTRALDQVLTDLGFRSRAKRLQRRMLALPPVETLVDDFESLVGS